MIGEDIPISKPDFYMLPYIRQHTLTQMHAQVHTHIGKRRNSITNMTFLSWGSTSWGEYLRSLCQEQGQRTEGTRCLLSDKHSFLSGTLTLTIPVSHKCRIQSHSDTVPNRWETMQMSFELPAVTSSSLIGH